MSSAIKGLGTVMVVLAGAVHAGSAREQRPPVFRSGANVVLVDVLVRRGGVVVRGLTKDDFEVLDNGVPQEIDDVLAEQLPIDLTILLDTSGSTAHEIERFKSSAGEIAAMLRPEDRMRITAFAADIRDLMPLTSHARFDMTPLGWTTSLDDALVLTLARRNDPARRHLIVAYTDADDTSSVVDGQTVGRAARRSEAVMHLVLPAAVDVAKSPRVRILRDAAEATGGAMVTRLGDAMETLRQVFVDFRQCYVLRYTPVNVPLEGRHELSVGLRRADAQKYTVQARKGYGGS
jgi:hypothetical protein